MTPLNDTFKSGIFCWILKESLV